jgi:hypothetical protein
MRTTTGLVAVILTLSSGHCIGREAPASKDQIVRTIREGGKHYDLIWGRTESSYNNRELFVTVHRSDGDSENDIASIYERIGDRYKLLRRIHSQSSWFAEPKVVWATVEGSNSGEQLIVVTELFPGTAHLREEHVFLVRSDSGRGLEDVEFVSAPMSLDRLLRPGEGVWKGAHNDFSDTSIAFTFYIWKEGDGNCCPTAGKVVGTYALELHDSTFRITAKHSKRLPLPPDPR